MADGLLVGFLKAAAVFVLAAAGANAAQAAPACDRACLDRVLDGYLGALQTHDRSRLRLAPDVRVQGPKGRDP